MGFSWQNLIGAADTFVPDAQRDWSVSVIVLSIKRSRNSGLQRKIFGKTTVDAVKTQFEIDDLTEQVHSLKAFFVLNHVFVNFPTGYGKSLIFHCLPTGSGADVLQNKPRSSSIVVVTMHTDQILSRETHPTQLDTTEETVGCAQTK